MTQPYGEVKAKLKARIAELEGEVAEANSGRYQDAARSVSANTRATTKLVARIAELEAENARLTAINADLCAVNLRHAEALAIRETKP